MPTDNPATGQRSPFLESLYTERRELEAFIERTIQGAMTGGPDGGRRDLSTSEKETLTRTRTRIGELDDQIQPLEEFEQLRSAGDTAARNYPRPTPAAQPPQPGGTDGGRTSLGAHTSVRAHNYRSRGEVIVDQLRAAPQNMGGESDQGARERLLSAGVIYAGIADADIAVARSNARDAANRLANDPTQARVTQVTADTPGILPVPIIGDIMSDVDGARPFINSLGAKPLAFSGDSFKRPIITSHSAVGKQTTQATSTGLGSAKLVIGSVSFAKETWGGYLDISRQDLDWTSPAAWDAILADLQEQYALQTENAAADAFAAAVPAATAGSTVATGAQPLTAWITALYAAAATSYTGAGQLPDTIWASLDMWSTLGPMIESQVATNQQPGTTSPGSFQGDLLRLPRIVVPSFPNGTLVLGPKRWSEVYEERIGLLTAVLPSVLGVQIAYGGYVAYNTLKAAAYGRVTKTP